MEKALSIMLGIVTGMFLLQGLTEATRFGSFINKDSFLLEPGTVTKTNIIMWTDSEVGMPVTFTIEKPEGFFVDIYPNSFQLNSSPEGETELFLLPEGGYSEAKIVNVFINAGNDPGNYTVRITAEADEGESSIPVVQKRVFNLNITVQGEVKGDGKSEILAEEENNQTDNQEYEKKEEGMNTWFILVGIVVILIIGWVIYRHD